MWLDILQWLLPAGALAVLVERLLSPSITRAKELKSVEGIYKSLYEDLRTEVDALRKELHHVNSKMMLYEKVMCKAARCSHFSADCPMFTIMQINAEERHQREEHHFTNEEHLTQS